MTIDQIIKVDIAISEAMAIDGGYDTILIIGPLPKTPGGHMTPDVAGYTGTQDLKSAGFSTDDPVYIAASKVFAQSPKATMVMVAVQKTTSGSAEKVDVTLDRAKAVPGWYCICPAGIKEDFYQSIADWTESNEKFCVCETTGISASPVSDAMFRTAVIHATKENDCVNLNHLDLICEALDCEPDEILVRVPNPEPRVRNRTGFEKPATESKVGI